MTSTTILVTSITSLFGFLLNSTVLFFVLLRGRRKYHFLFGGFLLVCALWDIGIFLAMMRNGFPNELIVYGYVIFWPCVFIPALVYHFTCAYLDQPRKKSTIFIWVYCIIGFFLGVSGLGGRITGVYSYSWGNIFRPDSSLLLTTLSSVPVWYASIWSSCLFLFRAYRREPSTLARRHMIYILASFFVVSLALIKIAILYGVDNRYLMPTGMLLNDVSATLIGVAIVKYRLFDITLIVKKGTVYSALVALIVFVFSLSEHLLSTYVGHILGEQAFYIHLISIAAVVGVLMPVRQRLERGIEGFFAKKKVAF